MWGLENVTKPSKQIKNRCQRSLGYLPCKAMLSLNFQIFQISEFWGFTANTSIYRCQRSHPEDAWKMLFPGVWKMLQKPSKQIKNRCQRSRSSLLYFFKKAYLPRNVVPLWGLEGGKIWGSSI